MILALDIEDPQLHPADMKIFQTSKMIQQNGTAAHNQGREIN